MNKVEHCTRCLRKLTGKHRQRCWYCASPLCIVCSDSFGVCGCPGSNQAQREIVQALTRYKRGARATGRRKATSAKRKR